MFLMKEQPNQQKVTGRVSEIMETVDMVYFKYFRCWDLFLTVNVIKNSEQISSSLAETKFYPFIMLFFLKCLILSHSSTH